MTHVYMWSVRDAFFYLFDDLRSSYARYELFFIGDML